MATVAGSALGDTQAITFRGLVKEQPHSSNSPPQGSFLRILSEEPQAWGSKQSFEQNLRSLEAGRIGQH
jgi:hypothetical protein